MVRKVISSLLGTASHKPLTPKTYGKIKNIGIRTKQLEVT